MIEDYKNIEKSIVKKFRKTIWVKFIKAIKEYNLIKENDKIAVCISGGKDSFLLAKCLEELLRHGKYHFSLEYIVMNPGYNESNLKLLDANLKKLNINAHIFNAPIFTYTDNIDNACYICAKMRRGYLYNYAKELGCNKIALGHHFNDVIETILLNMIYNGSFSSMRPILKSDNYEHMELIRPLYYVRENDIKAWSLYNNLMFLDCACNVSKKKIGKRLIVKDLVNYLNSIYEEADKCIFNSSRNINLDTLLAYKKDKKLTNLIEEYERDD